MSRPFGSCGRRAASFSRMPRRPTGSWRRPGKRWSPGRRRGNLCPGVGPPSSDRPARAAVAMGHPDRLSATLRRAILRCAAARRRRGSLDRQRRGRRRSEWVRPGDALDAMADGRIGLWLPTSSTLQQLEHVSDVADVAALAPGPLGPIVVDEPAPNILRIVMPAGGGVAGQPVCAYLVGRRRFVLVDPGDPTGPALEQCSRGSRRTRPETHWRARLIARRRAQPGERLRAVCLEKLHELLRELIAQGDLVVRGRPHFWRRNRRRVCASMVNSFSQAYMSDEPVGDTFHDPGHTEHLFDDVQLSFCLAVDDLVLSCVAARARAGGGLSACSMTMRRCCNRTRRSPAARPAGSPRVARSSNRSPSEPTIRQTMLDKRYAVEGVQHRSRSRSSLGARCAGR